MDPVVRMTSLSSMPPVYPQRRLGGRLVERGPLLAVEGDGDAGQLHPGLAVDAPHLGPRAQVGAVVEGARLDGHDAPQLHPLRHDRPAAPPPDPAPPHPPTAALPTVPPAPPAPP